MPSRVEADTAPSPDTSLKVVRNARAASAGAPYGELRGLCLSAEGFEQALYQIETWPRYEQTPLVALPALARELGLSKLLYKDESQRFGLGSFKALGGAYAVQRVLARNGQSPAQVTVTCATDGNHGRSVAWGAQLFGCRCVIFVHEHVSQGRRDAIARYGAEVIEVPGNYDDAVRHAAREAERNGWTVVSDTSWPGYRQIPTDVMHGYGVIAHEVRSQVGGDEPPTHVFLQAGVGGLAAAICAEFWLHWGASRPRCIVIEPNAADCMLRSLQAGHPMAVHGALDTVMAGLACGEVSELAWCVLSEGADAAIAIDDSWAPQAMKRLANAVDNDQPIVAGETGAAGLAALLVLREDPAAWRTIGLGPTSRVLLVGSEGDTDPAIYQRVVGRSAATVRG